MSYYDYIISEVNIGDAMTRTMSKDECQEKSRKFQRAMEIFQPNMVLPVCDCIKAIVNKPVEEWRDELSMKEGSIFQCCNK